MSTELFWDRWLVNGIGNQIRYRFGLYRPASIVAGAMLSSPHIARARERSLGCPSTSTDLMTSIKTADLLGRLLWAGTVVYATAVPERHIVNKLRRI